MVEFVLPPLKANLDPPIAAPGSPGSWATIHDLLANLPPNLETGTLESRLGQLVSIPDIWAQVDVFKSALMDDKHPLRDRVRDEWRGLISIFALAGFFGYNLEVKTIDLKSLANDAAIDGAARAFAKAAFDMKPVGRMVEAHDWDTIGIVLIEEQPLALLVPSTILCPVRNFPKNKVAPVPWWQDSTGDRSAHLADPVAYRNHGLQPEHFFILQQYCEELRSVLAGVDDGALAGGDGGDLRNALLGHLNDFIRDVSRHVDSQFTPHVESIHLPNLNFPPQSAPRIYQTLGTVYVAHPTEETEDAALPIRPEFAAEFKGAILFDPEYVENGIEAAQFRIWRADTVRTLLDSRDRQLVIENEMAEEGYLFVTPDRIFTEKICEFASDTIENHSRGFKTRLLPVTPIALVLFSPQQLRESLRISKKGEERIVTLAVKFRSGQRYLLKKVFKPEDIESRDKPSCLASWPDFASPSWPWNFLFFSGNLSLTVAPRLVFSTDDVIHQLKQEDVPERKSKLLWDVAKGAVSVGDRLPLMETQTLHEVYRFARPIDAVFCDFAASNVSDYAGPESRQSAGLLLMPSLNRRESDKTDGMDFCVGIDFGTTNTSCFYRAGKDAPQPFTFRRRLVQPFGNAIESDFPEFAEYLPPSDIDTPFMTVLWDRGLEEANKVPVWSGVIFFLHAVEEAIDRLIGRAQRDFRFGLKWRVDEKSKAETGLFLVDTILMIMAEIADQEIAAKNVEWRFSYPEAFDREHRNDFKGQCRSAVKMIAGNEAGNIEVGFLKESEAAAYFFERDANAGFMDNVITVDIGGQTADISIWQAGKTLWHGSFLFAGRQMPIDFLVNNQDIMKSLLKKEPKAKRPLALLEKAGKGSANRTGGVEIIVNSAMFTSAIESNRINEIDGSQSKYFRLAAEVALAGLLFYIGKVVASLSDFRADVSDHVQIYLGGKGSSLYRSFFENGGKDSHINKDYSAIVDVFLAAAGKRLNNAEVVFSNSPKQEVAYGLVAGTDGLLLESADANGDDDMVPPVLVETAHCDGKELHSVAELTDAMINSDDEIRIRDLNGLQEFIDFLKSSDNVEIQITDDIRSQIIGSINKDLATMRQRLIEEKKGDRVDDGEGASLQPTFVIALRELIARINRGTVSVRKN